jgi:hypothetical protein
MLSTILLLLFVAVGSHITPDVFEHPPLDDVEFLRVCFRRVFGPERPVRGNDPLQEGEAEVPVVVGVRCSLHHPQGRPRFVDMLVEPFHVKDDALRRVGPGVQAVLEDVLDATVLHGLDAISSLLFVFVVLHLDTAVSALEVGGGSVDQVVVLEPDLAVGLHAPGNIQELVHFLRFCSSDWPPGRHGAPVASSFTLQELVVHPLEVLEEHMKNIRGRMLFFFFLLFLLFC